MRPHASTPRVDEVIYDRAYIFNTATSLYSFLLFSFSLSILTNVMIRYVIQGERTIVLFPVYIHLTFLFVNMVMCTNFPVTTNNADILKMIIAVYITASAENATLRNLRVKMSFGKTNQRKNII